jgi:hypothetical protein
MCVPAGAHHASKGPLPTAAHVTSDPTREDRTRGKPQAASAMRSKSLLFFVAGNRPNQQLNSCGSRQPGTLSSRSAPSVGKYLVCES